ncbi:aminoglycoside phosphotransferase [Streptomyces sp. NPDC001678]|uniref:aminoglycoside phosphotransferase n=1 Tax=Streptomyces sp. NPDC001678 TaxID=3364599 RepID=UPI003674DBCB
MPTHRLTEIPTAVQDAIETVAGPVFKAEMLSAGFNSEIAARLHTPDGAVFVKGLRTDHPRVWTQDREAAINPYVQPVAPALLWHVREAGWDLLGFEDIDAPHADYSPGSPHLPLVVEALRTLADIAGPDIPLRAMPQRMETYVDDPAVLELFDGDRLLHTDWNTTNVLVKDRARIVDWAWASTGAGWIDPALWIIWLVASGHTPAQAETLAGGISAWNIAPAHGVDAFAQAQRRLWDEIAGDATDAWTSRMRAAARSWAVHRCLG